MALSHYISFVYVCEALGRYPYPAEDVIELEGRPPAEEVIRDIWDRLKQASRNARGPLFRGVRLSDNFIKSFVAKDFRVSRIHLRLQTIPRALRVRTEQEPARTSARTPRIFLIEEVRGLMQRRRTSGASRIER